jgi:ArsR family transcriptional regulator
METALLVLKAISQPTRLRILLLLAEAELCSCELVELLGVTQPAISQHMNVLRGAGLVSERKSGTWVYYQLQRSNLEQALQWLSRAVLKPRLHANLPTAEWSRLDQLLADRQQNCDAADPQPCCETSKKGCS